jgi:hypothetical protein
VKPSDIRHTVHLQVRLQPAGQYPSIQSPECLQSCLIFRLHCIACTSSLDQATGLHHTIT